jgi:hypothetical protein
MRFVLKLLPLVALFAFGAFTVGLPKAAQANLGTLTVSAATAPIGGTVTTTASLSNVAGATVSLTATSGNFVAGSVSTGETVSVNTTVLSFTGAGSTAASVFTGLYICETPGTVTFILQQNPAPSSGSAFLTATVLCNDIGTSTLTVTPPTQTPNLPVVVTGTCAVAGQLLTSVGAGVFSTVPVATNLSVTAPTTASCIAAGAFSINYVCSIDGTVTFSTGGTTATLVCTGGYNPYVNPVCPTTVTNPYTNPYGAYPYGSQYPYGTGYPYSGTNPYASTNPYATTNPYSYNYGSALYPYANPYTANPYLACPTPVAPGPNVVTATTSTSNLSCGGTAFVTITAHDSAGANVVNGTSVMLTASMGTISPSTASTTNGSVLATYTAPATGTGTATINVAAGTATTSTTISIECNNAVVAPPPAGAPVLIPPTQAITPPRTGDAGLVAAIIDCDD